MVAFKVLIGETSEPPAQRAADGAVPLLLFIIGHVQAAKSKRLPHLGVLCIDGEGFESQTNDPAQQGRGGHLHSHPGLDQTTFPERPDAIS